MSGDERSFPRDIDYYQIRDDGSVVQSSTGNARVYIGESDVNYFNKTHTMLRVRRKYGSTIGVMRDTRCAVKSKEYVTPKMLLGVAKK